MDLAARIATLDEIDVSHFTYGACVSFAVALTQIDPTLTLVTLHYGDPEDEYTERHVMAHDDTHAYDAGGVRLMSEVLDYDAHVDAYLSIDDLDESLLCEDHDVELALQLLGAAQPK